MNRSRSQRSVLFIYFVPLILGGAVLLAMPFSWSGAGGISFVDALFTSVSAVCVTGLGVVDTSSFSLFGKIVLLILIQAGGLGIITFSLIFLFLRSRKMPLNRRAMVDQYSFFAAHLSTNQIIRNIVLFTLLTEISGTLLLYPLFSRAGIDNPLGVSFFHAVSAFCNAGFSLFPDSLVSFADNGPVLIIISLLIITGGLGFLVLWDLWLFGRKKRKRLLFHTRVMLLMTAILIVFGTLAFYFFERRNVLSDMPGWQRWLNAFFQSITLRTAGFNTLDQGELSPGSQIVSFIFMMTGGGSGSMAGGIKVSTVFILILLMIRGVDSTGDIWVMKRRITPDRINAAVGYFYRAVFILLVCVLLLCISESPLERGIRLDSLIFEAISALGTVGLSHGITASLSFTGKCIIMGTMFAGRIALFSFILPGNRSRVERLVELPKGDILIG